MKYRAVKGINDDLISNKILWMKIGKGICYQETFWDKERLYIKFICS